MAISEKVAYLKGLADGMKLDADKDTNKLILAMIDTLDEMAALVDEIDEDLADAEEHIDEVDECLADVEDIAMSAVMTTAAAAISMRSPAPAAARPSPLTTESLMTARWTAPTAARNSNSTLISMMTRPTTNNQ